MLEVTKKYDVYLTNGKHFRVVNVTRFERINPGEVRFFDPSGKMSDYFNGVSAVQERS